MTGAPRFQVVAFHEGVFAVEDSAITQGQVPAVAIFNPRDLIDPQQEATALAQRMNAEHDQREAAKQRRADLHALVDVLNDAQIEWTLTTLTRKDRYFDAFETLFGKRDQ
ncbi:hypothetical protein [Deinococcus radiotolerans]|uniref:Uncharacterized protein n=1 Tax=Deinococcus radiotolerans TaxID=1309407 RepID=A0ABQ2FQ63_9DEIO|nr:hypothetical protein [Deinococcus radiotolerans]GGL15713.1 hypothetical protein GCM10010844_38320 [Deinococcus radiotolerans]